MSEGSARDWRTVQSRVTGLHTAHDPLRVDDTALLRLTLVDVSESSPRSVRELWHRFPSLEAAEACHQQLARCARHDCSFRLHYDRRTGELDHRPVVALHMCGPDSQRRQAAGRDCGPACCVLC